MVHSRQSKIILILFLFFLALGIFFRVYDLGQRNLWTDEAWVALAATQPTPSEVLQAGKSTPPLYLLTVWGMVQVFGRSETALRLASCLLGLGTLLLLWPLVQALLPPWSALTAFALGSVSNRLVYFSKELKQYSADIFFAVLIFFLVERQLQRQGRNGWLLFTALLALGLGFSHPLVFIMPVAALVLWWKLPQARKAITFSFSALALTFFVYFWFFFRGQVDPDLLTYWQCDFPDMSCGRDFICWLGAGWSRFGRYFFNDWGAPLGFVFLVSGLIFFSRSNERRVIWYFFGPILAALIAAFAERYPFMGHAGGIRLMMFNAPMLIIVTGAGIAAIFSWLWGCNSTGDENMPLFTSRPDSLPSKGEVNVEVDRTRVFYGKGGTRPKISNWSTWAGIVLAAVVIFWLQPAKLWQENLHPEANREEIKPLLQYLQTHRRPGDAIFVYYFAIDPFKFYYSGPKDDIMLGKSCHDASLPLPPERRQRMERLWMVFSHFETEAFVDSFVAKILGQGWTKQLELSQTGAILLCYLPPWNKTAAGSPAVIPPGP
jgi:Dolichyl-phosphate-mannose-protein mannosyltransferase